MDVRSTMLLYFNLLYAILIDGFMEHISTCKRTPAQPLVSLSYIGQISES